MRCGPIKGILKWDLGNHKQSTVKLGNCKGGIRNQNKKKTVGHQRERVSVRGRERSGARGNVCLEPFDGISNCIPVK